MTATCRFEPVAEFGLRTKLRAFVMAMVTVMLFVLFAVFMLFVVLAMFLVFLALFPLLCRLHRSNCCLRHYC